MVLQFVKRNRRPRIGLMLSEPRFNQLFIGCRQRRVIQFQSPVDQNLPLLKRKEWKLGDDLAKTHRRSLTSLCCFFNGERRYTLSPEVWLIERGRRSTPKSQCLAELSTGSNPPGETREILSG